jgi:hypothetical protein
MSAVADRVTMAAELMRRFAKRTGLAPPGTPRRYLWTDAFAVCNFLGLAEASGRADDVVVARSLVDQVHRTLGRHRADDERRGWISGLGEEEGSLHPTVGGLRIGKPVSERGACEPFDERLEWERDGQYFHYLTKWMHALDQMARATRDPVFGGWARELAETAHRAFVRPSREAGRKQMIWKASIDLTRPLVPSMGQHDPLDGYVTCVQLERSLGARDDQGLQLALVDFASMVNTRALATSDPLGIGGLLVDAARLCQLVEPPARASERMLIEAVLSAAAAGLHVFLLAPERRLPAAQRLAFRELGLAIGLGAIARLRGLPGRHIAEAAIAELDERYGFLRAEIEEFWIRPESRRVPTWLDHADINDVMLATSLAPDGFVLLRPL